MADPTPEAADCKSAASRRHFFRRTIIGSMVALPGVWCPYIHVADASPRSAPWKSPQRLLTHWLAVTSAGGREEIVVDDRAYDIPSGGAYLVQPGSQARLRGPEGSAPGWVHFDLAWDPMRETHPQVHTYAPAIGDRAAWMQPRAAAILGTEIPVVVPDALLPAFRLGLPAVIAEWRRGGQVHARRAAADLGLLVLLMAEHAAGRGSAARSVEERIVRAEEVARAGLAAGAGLPQMAAAAGLGRSRFCALYARLRGTSPGAFLRRERLARARELLERSDLPVTEIAAQVGYADATVFGRAFRAASGYTPGAWRSAQY